MKSNSNRPYINISLGQAQKLGGDLGWWKGHLQVVDTSTHTFGTAGANRTKQSSLPTVWKQCASARTLYEAGGVVCTRLALPAALDWELVGTVGSLWAAAAPGRGRPEGAPWAGRGGCW